MCPPEVVWHTMDSGLTIYMFNSLQQRQISGGMNRDMLDKQHVVRMSITLRCQSERDFPCGFICSGLIIIRVY
jgi:hypothetical protein